MLNGLRMFQQNIIEIFSHHSMKARSFLQQSGIHMIALDQLLTIINSRQMFLKKEILWMKTFFF